jgi:CubicO group peptidase (beta-lactamase class C family)
VKRAIAVALLLFVSLGAAPPSAVHRLTPADLDAFFGGFVPYAIERGDVAGGVVAVVHDGKLIFVHGYGCSDLARKTPVTPETLFRVGSISKLFTWTSIMQLVQEHKIALDGNVNDYLDFHIPQAFGQPITVQDLMTHTPGFEESISGLIVQKPDQLIPLREYLVNHIPREIFPPGTIVAYSNYGATVAGYIVQHVSGELFADYVAHHILQPLGMNDSTFVQPLPARLQPLMSKGYMTASDRPFSFELLEGAPAGAFTTNADDIARFMIAQLNDGRYDGAQILAPQTAGMMHTTHHLAVPGLLNGFDLGFYDENRNGHRIIGHGGDTIVFHSDLHLILDADTGLFISFNSLGKEGAAGDVRTAIFKAFLNRYFPYTAPTEPTIRDPKRDAARVAGYYIASRRDVSGLRLFWALSQAKVSALPSGEITVSVLRKPNGAPIHWREVGPLAYRAAGGQTGLRFATDAAGKIAYFGSDDDTTMVYQKVQGLKQQGTMTLLTTISLVLFLLAVCTWIGGWIVRAYYKRPFAISAQAARLRIASRIGALLFLALIVGWVEALQAASANTMVLFDFNGTLTVLYILGLLAIFGGLAMIANSVSRVIWGPGGVIARTGELLLGLAALYGIWAIFAYSLATFNYHY